MTGSLIFLGISIVTTSCAHLLYKLYFRHHARGLLAGAIAAFCCSPYLIYRDLIHIPLDYVYMSNALVLLLVVLLSMAVFGDRISRSEWGGILLVIGGLIIYSL